MKEKLRKLRRYRVFQQQYWDYLKNLRLPDEFEDEVDHNEASMAYFEKPTEWNSIPLYLDHLKHTEGESRRYKASKEIFETVSRSRFLATSQLLQWSHHFYI